MRTVLLLCLGLVLAACDDDGPRSPAACQLTCERAAACTAPADRRACASSCSRVPGYPEPALSPRYLDAVRRCIAAVPCTSPDLYVAGDLCAQQEALRLKPSKSAEALCRRALSADRSCGVVTLGDYTCLDDVKIYDDAVLRAAARCYDGPCRTHGACVDDVFGYRVGPF